jgi:hypothetical protein
VRHFTLSHCAGDKCVSAALRKTVADAITGVTVKAGPGAATRIRGQLLSQLKASGWSGEVCVSADSDMTITAAKDDIGLCIQTGNISRVYADLMKLQAMYLDNLLKGAVIVLPSQDTAKLLGDNIAQAKRLERELSIFKKAYHVPTLVFAMES